MKKDKKLSLLLNKEVVEQLDKNQASEIKGGVLFTSLWGSNCNNSDPNRHKCCAPDTTLEGTCSVSGACTSVDTFGCSPN